MCLLRTAYKPHLRAIVEAALSRVSEEVLSAGECIGDQRAVLWIGKNQARPENRDKNVGAEQIAPVLRRDATSAEVKSPLAPPTPA